MRNGFAICCIAGALLALGGCGNRDEAQPQPVAAPNPNVEPPATVYTKVSAQIKNCWLDPIAAKLPDHVFNATVDERSRAPLIEIAEITPDGARGATAFGVLFTNGQDDPSGIRTQNFRLPPDRAQALTADIQRWSHGQLGCSRASRTAESPLPRAAPRQY